MKVKAMLLILALMCMAGTQLYAIPDLYVNGSLWAPAGGPNDDIWGNPNSNVWRFTLLYEQTPSYDQNTFGYYTDMGVGSNMFQVFDDNESPITVKDVDFTGIYTIGFFLHNDLNDNSIFDGTDALLFSERALTIPNPPGSNYQWFRAYNTPGYAHYYFEAGPLDFWGDYDALLFIDDDHVTSPNWDHNDMVVGINVSPIPEPATLILLGLGLAGSGLIRRRAK